MPIHHSTTAAPSSGPPRLVVPIPGVPDEQTRALDRRWRLHRQLQTFRGPVRAEPKGAEIVLIDPAEPGQE
jgi:hypothetical protein